MRLPILLKLGAYLAILLSANSAFSQATELFISEYAEGSSSNKYVEIYNGTGASVDLSEYEIWGIQNGGNWTEITIPLSGILLNGEVYVVASSSANSGILAQADLTSGSVQWNGDDAVGLAKNDILIDAVGTDGADPGSSWAVGSSSNGTSDHKLIRKPSICSPNINWVTSSGTSDADSEWIVFTYSVDATTVGSHTANCAPVGQPPVVNLGPDFSICDLDEPIILDAGNPGAEYLWSTNETTQTIQITSPGEYSVLVVNDEGDDFDEISISLDPACSPPVANFGESLALCALDFPYTLDAGNAGALYGWGTGETSQSIEINEIGNYFVLVTNAAGSEIFEITITESTDCPTICGNEDFSNSNLTGSYADGSFTGNNGITWTYIESRDENGDANNSGIDGNAILLRDNTSSLTSSSISGGVGRVEMKLYKGFTGGGNRQVELFINGISYGVSEAFDDYNVRVFVVNNIDVEVPAIVEIRNISDKQVIVDDINWTCYSSGIVYDCPDEFVNYGDPCNDGNELTVDDQIQSDCSCAGTLLTDTENPEANCIPAALDVELNSEGLASVNAEDLNNGSTDNFGVEGLSFTAEPNSLSCDNLGENTLTLTVTDEAGNSASCPATVNVIDLINPELTLPAEITLQLNEDGEAVLNEAALGLTANDNCGAVSISFQPETFNCAALEPVSADDLIISEYIEGSGNNKYIEIYNGTAAAVDLANYELRLYANGAAAPTTTSPLAVAGSLAPGGTVVFRNNNAEIYNGPTIVFPAVNFNGDDAIALYNLDSEQTIDIFGRIDQDPGSAWTQGGNTTVNKTLRRKAEVLNGNVDNATDFPALASEWDQYDEDDVSGLGNHSSTAGGITALVTATDAAGNAVEGSISILLEDNLAPEIICPDDIEAVASILTGTATVNYELSATDNCLAEFNLIEGPASGEAFPLGTTTVTYEAVDGSGNTANCSFNVNVVESGPYASFVLNSSTAQPSECDEFTVMVSVNTTDIVNLAEARLTFDPALLEVVSITAPDGGNLPAAPLGNIVLPANFNNTTGTIVYAAAEYGLENLPSGDFDFFEITFRTLADNGNTAITPITTGFPKSLIAIANPNLPIPVSINVLESAEAINLDLAPDASPPIAICQNITVQLDETGMATISAEDLDNGSYDLCSTASISIAAEDANITCADIPSKTVVLSVTDEAGNTASCEATVTVEDNIDPLSPVLEDVVAECGTTITAPTTTDNCAGTITGTTSDPIEYTDQGNFQISWTFADGNGNSTVAVQTVIINDTTDPLSPVLEDVVAECGTTVTAPTTTDNCAGTITGTTNDPIEYNQQGSFEISWTFDDGNGNSIMAVQTVIINDTTDPLSPVLEDVVAECGTTVTAPTTTDNCAGTITGTTDDPIEYTEQGTFEISWTFNDGNGNSTMAIQTVIIDDTTDPLTPVLEDVVAECGTTLTAPTTTDNCAGTITGTTDDPIEYTQQGTFEIIWTFDDGNGNVINAEQTVIIDDTTAPETPVLATITEECSALLTAPTTTDNCGGIITGTTAITEFTEQGTFIVTWTFDDGNGNSTSANQTVIIEDTTAPEIACSDDQTVTVNMTGNGYLISGTAFDAVATDNCSITSLTHNAGEIPGAIAGADNTSLDGWQLPIGAHEISFVAVDAGFNQISCTVTITVLPISISGTATINLNCTPLDIRLLVYQDGGLIETAIGSLDENGDFVIALEETLPGTYQIYVKVERYLQKVYTVEISETGATLNPSGLTIGDITPSGFGDNDVDAVDLSLLIDAYNTQSGDALYNAIPDLNCNGQVDGLDLSLLIISYGQVGVNP